MKIQTKKFTTVRNFTDMNNSLYKFQNRHRKLGNKIVSHGIQLDYDFRNILGYESQYSLTLRYTIEKD